MSHPLMTVQRNLQCFIEQQDKAIRLVEISTPDLGTILRLLSENDMRTRTDLYLVNVEDFVDSRSFASIVVQQVHESYLAANLAIEASGNEPAPADFPMRCLDEAGPPSERVRDALCYARDILPEDGGHRLVWVLFPPTIVAAKEYIELIGELIAHDPQQAPWFSSMRMFIREPENLKFPFDLHQSPLVEAYVPDLGIDAMVTQLEKTAQDTSRPDKERAVAQLQLGTIATSRGKGEDALENYMNVLAYAQEKEDRVMETSALIGVGDTYRNAGQLDEAREVYESAVDPALVGDNPILLYTLSTNLGNLCLRQEEYEDARCYYDAAQQVSLRTGAVESKISALELRAQSEEKLSDLDAAADSYKAAIECAIEYDELPATEGLLPAFEALIPETREQNKRWEELDILRRGISDAHAARQQAELEHQKGGTPQLATKE